MEVHDKLCCPGHRAPRCAPEMAGVGQTMLYLCLRIKQPLSQLMAMEAERQCKANFIFVFCPPDFWFGGGWGCVREGPEVSSSRFVNALVFFLARTAEMSIPCTQQLLLSALRLRHIMLLPELPCKVWWHCHQDTEILSLSLL